MIFQKVNVQKISKFCKRLHSFIMKKIEKNKNLGVYFFQKFKDFQNLQKNLIFYNNVKKFKIFPKILF